MVSQQTGQICSFQYRFLEKTLKCWIKVPRKHENTVNIFLIKNNTKLGLLNICKRLHRCNAVKRLSLKQSWVAVFRPICPALFSRHFLWIDIHELLLSQLSILHFKKSMDQFWPFLNILLPRVLYNKCRLIEKLSLKLYWQLHVLSQDRKSSMTEKVLFH